MSVSSISTLVGQTYQPTGAESSDTANTAGSSGAAAAGDAAQSSGNTGASTSTDSQSSSSMISLTPGAQGLASLAAAGITFETESFASMGLTANDFQNAQTPEQFSALWQKVAKAGPTAQGSVSQSDFEKFASKLGATKDEADQMFEAFDTNQDGSISNEEFLVGLASTLKDGSSAFAQSILQLMDTDHNGSVDASEFGAVESSFVQAEKPAG